VTELGSLDLKIDLLINNAGLGLTGDFLSHDLAEELASIIIERVGSPFRRWGMIICWLPPAAPRDEAAPTRAESAPATQQILHGRSGDYGIVHPSIKALMRPLETTPAALARNREGVAKFVK
jgi:hypothetical protein